MGSSTNHGGDLQSKISSYLYIHVAQTYMILIYLHAVTHEGRRLYETVQRLSKPVAKNIEINETRNSNFVFQRDITVYNEYTKI